MFAQRSSLPYLRYTAPFCPKRMRSETGPCRLRIEYAEALPLQEFYAIIDDHFQRRKDLQSASEDLNRAAHQYRVVEKRLLSRFKDRNPAPLNNLDMVSEETYERLVELGEGVERAQGRLADSAANLGCAARLVALLAQHRFQLPCKDHALLLAHLFPDVTDTDDQVNERRLTGVVFQASVGSEKRLREAANCLGRSCPRRSKKMQPVPAGALFPTYSNAQLIGSWKKKCRRFCACAFRPHPGLPPCTYAFGVEQEQTHSTQTAGSHPTLTLYASFVPPNQRFFCTGLGRVRRRGDDAPPPHLPREGCQGVGPVVGGADAAPLDAARHREAQEAHLDRVRQAQQGSPARSPTRGAPLEPSIIVVGHYVVSVVPEGGFPAVANHRDGARPNLCVQRSCVLALS